MEVFDFAMRRRFAWVEIKANDVMETVLYEMLMSGEFEKSEIDGLAEHAMTLNQKISEIPGLNYEYHIGPAYFGKIKQYPKESCYRDLWINHIEPLLNEYFRGMGQSDAHLNECKDAFRKMLR